MIKQFEVIKEGYLKESGNVSFVKIKKEKIQEVVPREWKNLEFFMKINKYDATIFCKYFVEPRSFKVFDNNIKKSEKLKNLTEESWYKGRELYEKLIKRFEGKTGIKIKMHREMYVGAFWVSGILLDKRLKDISEAIVILP
jgi:hypothetical protein